jgi:hypothetical protein
MIDIPDILFDKFRIIVGLIRIATATIYIYTRGDPDPAPNQAMSKTANAAKQIDSGYVRKLL